MMATSRRAEFNQRLNMELQSIRDAGLWKGERIISTPQSAHVTASTDAAPKPAALLNMCANNYLGLANDRRLIQAGKDGMDRYGYGLASVRFICGTQSVHKELEEGIASFLGMEDCILYSSCFDANGGLFETILTENDAVISDALNHASIIDGIRLCKAKRYRYANNNLADLRTQLEKAVAAKARTILIATDGVFSMDGIIANLSAICDLADNFGALVMVDDSHAVGFIGDGGRGTPELCGVMKRVDIITGTLGKALGGSSGGYTAASKTIVSLLRQRSRPYLFSNSLAPSITAATLECLKLLQSPDGAERRKRLRQNSEVFRSEMAALGFKLTPGVHPIIPVMIGDASKAAALAESLYRRGVFAVAFSYPVVPKGAARIRTQMSAAHTTADIKRAVAAFADAGRECGIISGTRNASSSKL